VDAPPPAAIDDRVLAGALRDRWSLDTTALSYVPKGVGSYHWRVDAEGMTYFVTVDDLATKPWLGHELDDTFEGLECAYETAWQLHHDDRLDLVVAPVRTRQGAVLVRLDERHTMAVFPFVDGEATAWGDAISDDRRAALLHALGRVHGAARGDDTRVPRRGHGLPGREHLLDAMASLDRPWQSGDHGARVQQALRAHETEVRARLARFDALAAQLDASQRATVITHGEPHPGNLIHTRDGVRLVDWDTVALSEPERDLWMLDRGRGSLDAYVAATGRTLDAVALEFHRLSWTMSDIVSYTALFRRGQPRTRWADAKLTGLVALLAGAESLPYGEPSP